MKDWKPWFVFLLLIVQSPMLWGFRQQQQQQHHHHGLLPHQTAVAPPSSPFSPLSRRSAAFMGVLPPRHGQPAHLQASSPLPPQLGQQSFSLSRRPAMGAACTELDVEHDDRWVTAEEERNRLLRYPPISVIYEDDDLMVVDKPAGISHHDEEEESHHDHSRQTAEEHNNNNNNSARSGAKSPGILSLVRFQLQHGILQRHHSPFFRDDEVLPRLYGVHRLDKVTSGVLILAKHAAAARYITNAFREQRVVKYYTGLSYKKPHKKKQGYVRGCLQRGRRKSWYLTPTTKTTTTNSSSCLYACTRFFTAGLGNLMPRNDHCPTATTTTTTRQQSRRQQPPQTLILFRPYTGRTHQLRVTAKSVGLPLAGDPLYTTTSKSGGSSSGDGPPPNRRKDDDDEEPTRTYLHATALQMQRIDGTTLTLWSPPSFCHFWQEHEEVANPRPPPATTTTTTTTSALPLTLHSVLVRLLEKHCDCPEIVALGKEGSLKGEVQ